MPFGIWWGSSRRSLSDLFDAGPLAVYRAFDAYSESGAVGDPSLATAEQGERIYRRLGDELGALLEEIHERNSP